MLRNLYLCVVVVLILCSREIWMMERHLRMTTLSYFNMTPPHSNLWGISRPLSIPFGDHIGFSRALFVGLRSLSASRLSKIS